MEPIDLIKMYFSMLASQFPVVIVCIVACIMILVKWKQGAGGSLWAIIAFGFALILCFVMPGISVAVQRAVIVWGRSPAIFAVVGIVGSILHAVVYVLLLVAVFAGRPKAQAARA